MRPPRHRSWLYLGAIIVTFLPLLILGWFLFVAAEDSLIAEKVRSEEQAEKLLCLYANEAENRIREGNAEFEKIVQAPKWYEQLRKDPRIGGIRGEYKYKLRSPEVSQWLLDPAEHREAIETWIKTARAEYAPAFILFTLQESGLNTEYPLLEDQLSWETNPEDKRGISLENGVSILWNREALPALEENYQWQKEGYDAPVNGCGEAVGIVHAAPTEHEEAQASRTLLTLICLGWIFACLLILLLYAKKKEREARESVDQLSAVAHELRTPLTGMKLLLERLQNSASLPLDSRKSLSQIEEERQRLEGVMEQFLVQGKLHAQGLQCSLTPWQDWLGYEHNRHLALGTAETTLVLLPPHESKVYFDKSLMGIVLSNLLKNAQQYGEGSAIQIIEIAEDNAVGFEVRDQGPGIPLALQRKVFTKYERGEMALSRNSEGLGLGLSLAKEIVQLHHGAISLCSEIGNGTRVRVILPLES